jgi:hypothetical protein
LSSGVQKIQTPVIRRNHDDRQLLHRGSKFIFNTESRHTYSR